ncbi:MAG: hypothetical protein WCB18_03570 [Thermoplasmata archaeon]
MVFVADWGSKFDAPVEVVWQFVMSDDDHGDSHKGRRNVERKSINENTVMLSWEQNMDGNWVKLSNRLTFHPPIGFFVEPMEGPMAGSKFFNYYVPKGHETEVVVVGDWHSKMIPEAQLEKAVMANLEHVFQEDTAGIKGFKEKRVAHAPAH